jgi:hypothetical protein
MKVPRLASPAVMSRNFRWLVFSVAHAAACFTGFLEAFACERCTLTRSG